MMTREELVKLLSDTESHNIERTESTNNMDKFCQAICAFSNDVSGSGKSGYLIIGAKDNGDLSGLKVDDKLLLQIANIRTDGNILPQPLMSVEKFSFDNGDILVAEVQASEFPPVRYRGRVWVRVGPRKSVASEAEEKLLTERRLSNVHTFDAMPCLGTTIADLDVSLIKKEYLPKAVANDILLEDKRSIEEQLTSLGLYDIRYNCPTNGAIILFGMSPERYLHGSYIQYVRFKGKDRAGDIVNEHKFSACLCRELPKIDAFVETSIAQKRPIPVSVLREETVAKYPYWATRELLMNAIMHKDYETNAPVFFYEYDDCIEIQNAGGLYGKVSPENFPNVSDYRNPFIAEAMKVLGYVNRFSRGVYRVQKELEDNGNGKAFFDFSLRTAFRVVEHVSKKYLEQGFGFNTVREMETEFSKSPEKAQEELRKSPEKAQEELRKSPEKAQEELRKSPEKAQEKPKKSPGKAQEKPKKSSEKAQEKPRKSSEKAQEKPKKSSEKAQEKPKKSSEKAQEKPKKSLRNIEDKILDEMKYYPQISRRELAIRFNRTEDSIRYYIRKLTTEGIIKHEGPTKGGKWVILQ